MLPAMSGLRPEQTWAMPGDPHPNALVHKLMADALLPLIVRRQAAGIARKVTVIAPVDFF